MSTTAVAKEPWQAFEYMIILQPKYDRDGEVVEPAEVVKERTAILAPNPTQAQIMAYRAIPDEYANGKLERVQVVLRPF